MELDLKANKLIEEIVAVIRSNLNKEKLVEKLTTTTQTILRKAWSI